MKKLFYIWLAEQMKYKEGEALRLVNEAGGIERLFQMRNDGFTTGGLGKSYDLSAGTAHAEDILNNCAQNGIGVITIEHELYPKRLRELRDPPLVLYYKGRWVDFDERLTVSIVGQRKASAAGKMLGEKFAYKLAQNGVYIVSGLAAGIDGAAHRGAIKAGGYTAGVLGTGVDVCYPVENAGLMRTMAKEGLVVSEFPPGTGGQPRNFPKRNRIVAALSRGTLVIEAQEKSGSLITARLAREAGRDVFALMGLSSGCQSLICKNLAQAVSEPEDIINYYGPRAPKAEKKESKPLTDEETAILKLIALGKDKEKIAEDTGLDISVVTRRINMLEIKGYIIKIGHSKYEIAERAVK